MSDNIIPEEKLLRLIRGQKKPEPTLLKTIRKAPPQFNAASASNAASLLTAHKIMALILAASAVYLVSSIILPVDKGQIRANKYTQPVFAGAKEAAPQNSYEDYLENIRGRQIFNEPSASARLPDQPAGIANNDAFKDITLVGIIAGDPLQAIIEDKKMQKTYYVTKGQNIGDLQVADILEGKIILSYQGKNFELYL